MPTNDELLQLGKQALQNGQYKEAIEKLSQIKLPEGEDRWSFENFPFSIEVFYHSSLAIYFGDNFQNDQKEKLFTKCAEKLKEHIVKYYNGSYTAYMKASGEKVPDFEDRTSEITYYCGVLYARNKKYQKAREVLEVIFSEHEKNKRSSPFNERRLIELNLVLGICFNKEKNFPKALEFLQRAEILAKALFEKELNKKISDIKELSEEEQKHILRIHTRFSVILQQIGFSQIHLKNYASAEQVLIESKEKMYNPAIEEQLSLKIGIAFAKYYVGKGAEAENILKPVVKEIQTIKEENPAIIQTYIPVIEGWIQDVPGSYGRYAAELKSLIQEYKRREEQQAIELEEAQRKYDFQYDGKENSTKRNREEEEDVEISHSYDEDSSDSEIQDSSDSEDAVQTPSSKIQCRR